MLVPLRVNLVPRAFPLKVGGAGTGSHGNEVALEYNYNRQGYFNYNLKQ